MRMEHFLDRVQRAGADVAEDDPDGTDDQAGEADLAMTLRVRLRVMRLAGVRFGHAIPGSPASAKRGL